MALFRSLVVALAMLSAASTNALAQPVQAVQAARNPVSVHVLDLQTGLPAAGMTVVLERREGDRWVPLAEAHTDSDGRVEALYPRGQALVEGAYRLTFQSGTWFQARSIDSLYPVVQVRMTVDGRADHYHVPLLLSPFGYSTYRGS